MKKWIAMLLMLCMLLTLAACAAKPAADMPAEETTDTAPETTVDTPAGETSEPAEDGEKKTITITWHESDSTQAQVMNDYVMPALAEAFPDVDFEYTGITTDKAEALKTMSATGSLTDIYCSDGAVYDTLIAAGNMMEISSLLEADGWLEQNFRNPSMLYNGDTIYCVNCGQDAYYTPVVYYNTELFAQLGLEEPTTMDEFKNVCQTLIDNGVYPITTCTTFFAYFMIDALISSYDPEALNELRSGKIDWTDERIVNALQVFDELKAMGAFAPDAPTKGDSDCLADFASGAAAMWPTMSWYNYNVAEGEVPFTTGTFNFPSGNADYPTGYQQLNWGSVFGGWAINPHTENLDLCVEVFKTILKAEAQRHADNGIQENFIVPGAAEPTNPLEIERMEDYNKATDYRTLLFVTGMDAATAADFQTDLSMLLADGDSYTSADFIRDMNESWALNTRVAS